MNFNLSSISPYIRLARFDKPTGFMLLFLPCLMAILLFAHNSKDYLLIPLFFIGSVFMRGVGCIINDYFDIDLDRQVERTSLRPLANNEVSKKNAIVFAILLSIIPFFIFIFFTPIAKILCLIAIIFVVFYPKMKLILTLPQLFLGITYNFGALIVYAQINNALSMMPVILYIALIFWTFAYDSIYSLQDLDDDIKIGINSAAVFFGKETVKIAFVSYSVMLIFLSLTILLAGVNMISIVFLMLLFSKIFYDLVKLDDENPADCLAFFNKNVFYGTVISLIIFL